MFVYLFFLMDKNVKLINKIFSIIIASAIILGTIYLFANNKIEVFNLLEERGTDDTRSGVEENFYKSMKGIDWVIGRGMLGEYYSPTLDISHRGTIETDYL